VLAGVVRLERDHLRRVHALERGDRILMLGRVRAPHFLDGLVDRRAVRRLELLAQLREREILRGLRLGLERRELVLLTPSSCSRSTRTSARLRRRRRTGRALVREIALELAALARRRRATSPSYRARTASPRAGGRRAAARRELRDLPLSSIIRCSSSLFFASTVVFACCAGAASPSPRRL